MEILCQNITKTAIKAIVLDFDGTLSTLRSGWESVMKPVFVNALNDGVLPQEEIENKVDNYINESTGIQTILQMKWLCCEVVKQGRCALDPWEYKQIYNDALMQSVNVKISDLVVGKRTADDYLIKGAVEFLKQLKSKHINIYVASGTDHPDVINEAKALGLYDLFDEIAGAPIHQENCSKEAVINRLIQESKYTGNELAVCGDGKVEIMLGKAVGARTIGIASNELLRQGINLTKRSRLIKAGADAICGDFTELPSIMNYLGL